MAGKSYDIIVSGHLCLDLIPEMAGVPVDAVIAPGVLSETGPITVGTGGAVSNTGLALNRLGARVGLMASVGDDLLGELIVSSLNTHGGGLSDLIQVQPGQASSYSVVLSPENKDRTFLHCTGTNKTFGPEHIDYALVENARLFHLGYPPLLPRMFQDGGVELVQIFRRVHDLGVVTSLDMSLPAPNAPAGKVNWAALLTDALPYVDIFVPSIEEALFALRRPDFDAWQGKVYQHLSRQYLVQLADELLAMGVAIAGFKLGELGFYLRAGSAARLSQLSHLPIDLTQWADAEAFHPAFVVDVAGTTGAGDSAYAGFLLSLLRGLSPQESVQMASAVGACNVEGSDSLSGVRTWDATLNRIHAGWPVRPEKPKGF